MGSGTSSCTLASLLQPLEYHEGVKLWDLSEQAEMARIPQSVSDLHLFYTVLDVLF